jgi:hypothetical protein
MDKGIEYNNKRIKYITGCDWPEIETFDEVAEFIQYHIDYANQQFAEANLPTKPGRYILADEDMFCAMELFANAINKHEYKKQELFWRKDKIPNLEPLIEPRDILPPYEYPFLEYIDPECELYLAARILDSAPKLLAIMVSEQDQEPASFQFKELSMTWCKFMMDYRDFWFEHSHNNNLSYIRKKTQDGARKSKKSRSLEKIDSIKARMDFILKTAQEIIEKNHKVTSRSLSFKISGKLVEKGYSPLKPETIRRYLRKYK